MNADAPARRPRLFDLGSAPAFPERGAVPAGDGGFPARRVLLDLGATAVPTGIAQLQAGEGAIDGHPRSEFILLTRGRLTLHSCAGLSDLRLGDAAVIPQGAAFRWAAADDLEFVFQTYAGPADGDAPVAVDPDAALEPSPGPDASLLTTPAPRCGKRVVQASADGEWTVGVWASTPGGRRAITYAHTELMHLLAGSVTLTDASGEARTFAAGSTFLVPRGAVYAWNNDVPVRKVYVSHRPRG